MRKAILAFVMVSVVVVSAQPAAAVDDGFRGWYRIIARQTLQSGCPKGDYERRTRVHHAEEMELQFGPYARHVNNDFAAARIFRYKSGKYYPWQHTRGRFVLRYEPATNSAVGVRYGAAECRWQVRLVAIGPPAKG